MSSYEIRVCASCGLRYPLVAGHPFGTRCPACMGETRVALWGQISAEGRTLSGYESGAWLAVLLDNIRSAWNVGSILRSADGFGFAHAYLCGITPTPENESVSKTSLGAEDSVSWSYHKDAVKVVKGLKAEGWQIYGLEEDARAHEISSMGNVTYNDQRAVVIVGSEVTGVDPELLDLCDTILYIPMRGEKKSFNVAVAFGIAAYAMRVKNEERPS